MGNDDGSDVASGDPRPLSSTAARGDRHVESELDLTPSRTLVN
jgi:hypothetical protein